MACVGVFVEISVPEEKIKRNDKSLFDYNNGIEDIIRNSLNQKVLFVNRNTFFIQGIYEKIYEQNTTTYGFWIRIVAFLPEKDISKNTDRYIEDIIEYFHNCCDQIRNFEINNERMQIN